MRRTSAADPSSVWCICTVTLVVGVPLHTDAIMHTRIAVTLGMASCWHAVCHLATVHTTHQVHLVTVDQQCTDTPDIAVPVVHCSTCNHKLNRHLLSTLNLRFMINYVSFWPFYLGKPLIIEHTVIFKVFYYRIAALFSCWLNTFHTWEAFPGHPAFIEDKRHIVCACLILVTFNLSSVILIFSMPV